MRLQAASLRHFLAASLQRIFAASLRRFQAASTASLRCFLVEQICTLHQTEFQTMEELYTKLYNKYAKLKKEKDTVMENLNHEQEVKFTNYVDAADEMMEHLRSENDRLNKQVSELRSEMALIRSSKAEECVKYQRLLMKENQKNKELSEEIERLHNLKRGLCHQDNGDEAGHGPVHTPGSSEAKPGSSNDISVITRKRSGQSLFGRGIDMSEKMTRKSSRLSLCGREIRSSPCAEEVELTRLCDSGNESGKQTMDGDAPPNYCLPECCRRKMNVSGDNVTQSSMATCIFQDLVEFVLGMKTSTISQSEEFGVSVHHPPSGYSFHLAWINNLSGEPELQYRLLSLGTFERVAPEWMRDVLVFSSGMVPTFFERVSRVIKYNH